jgi:hypothetical protein
MRLSEVGYRTENPSKDYSKGLSSANTLPKLISFLSEWEGLADDALTVAKGMSKEDFKTFRRCLKIERSGKFSGEAHAAIVGILMMPDLLIRPSVISLEYKVPWGMALIRLREFEKKQ